MFNSGFLNSTSPFIFRGDCRYLQLTLKQCWWIKSATGQRKNKTSKTHCWPFTEPLTFSCANCSSFSWSLRRKWKSSHVIFSFLSKPAACIMAWMPSSAWLFDREQLEISMKDLKDIIKGFRMNRNIHKISEMDSHGRIWFVFSGSISVK